MQSSSVFDPHSSLARGIVDLLNSTLVVCALILALVVGLIVYALWRFRAAGPEPGQAHGNRRLEIGWTLGPFLVLVYLFGLTVRAMHVADPAPQPGQQPDLVIVGRQFWWEVHYPRTGVVTANEIHLPVGRKLLVRLETADVIHSFWIPQLSRKMDMVPDRANFIWLAADQPGVYLGSCSEFCGAQHAWMRIRATAQSEEEFDSWQRQQQQAAALPREGAPRRGEQVFRDLTCANCHSIRGLNAPQQAAPDLTHLVSRRTLGAGVLTNTPENLGRWIRDPQAFKPGNLMPRMQLSDAQAADLLAFLQTLQ